MCNSNWKRRQNKRNWNEWIIISGGIKDCVEGTCTFKVGIWIYSGVENF